MQRAAKQRWRLAVALVTLGCSCATSGGQSGSLDMAVHFYNEGLRWKRFAQAAQYVEETSRPDFLSRYLGSEDDLHIESLEVRAVNPLSEAAVPTFLVTVAAESYRLPSTVLEKVIMVQRWEQRGEAWLLVSCEPELVPPREKAEK
jgi:hypothetical protein